MSKEVIGITIEKNKEAKNKRRGAKMKIIIKIRTTHLTTKPKQPKEKKVSQR